VDEQLLAVAEFDKDELRKYWLMKGFLISILSVVGIPLMAIWVPLAWIFMGRWIARLGAELTPTKLIIHRGYFVREEKVVPLEKITDLSLKQGPIMRRLGLEAIAVETAGQSSGPGAALVQLVGIRDTRGFRAAVLAQRDKVVMGGSDDGSGSVGKPAATAQDGRDTEVLEKIYTTLVQIERTLSDQ
jgi:putative membrane protein